MPEKNVEIGTEGGWMLVRVRCSGPAHRPIAPSVLRFDGQFYVLTSEVGADKRGLVPRYRYAGRIPTAKAIPNG